MDMDMDMGHGHMRHGHTLMFMSNAAGATTNFYEMALLHRYAEDEYGDDDDEYEAHLARFAARAAAAAARAALPLASKVKAMPDHLLLSASIKGGKAEHGAAPPQRGGGARPSCARPSRPRC